MNLSICVQVLIFIYTATHIWTLADGQDTKCLGNVLRVTIHGSVLAGKRAELDVVNGTNVMTITPPTATQCGYTQNRDPWDNILLYISLQHCFVQSMGGVSKTNLQLRTYDGHTQKVHDLSETCPLPQLASREVLCSRNYMEVFVEHDLPSAETLKRMTAGASSAISAQSGPGSAYPFHLKEVTFYTPLAQTFTPEELHRHGYALHTSPTRLLIRGPYNTSATYHQEVAGVPMAMMKSSVVYQHRRTGFLANAEAACPTGGVSVTGNSVVWRLPRHIPPMMSSDAVVVEAYAGLEGQRLDQATMQARGYSFYSTAHHFVLEMPLQSPEGYFKSLVHGRRYHITYSVEPMIELLWRESGDLTETRYKVLLPITTPPMHSPPHATVDADQAARMFKVSVGPFLHDVELLNIKTQSGVMTVEEAVASGFDVQQYALGNGSKVFHLHVPFSHPVTAKGNPNVKTETYAAQLELGFLVHPEQELFTHPVALAAAMEDSDMATVSGYCDNHYFRITVRYGSQGPNIETVIGRSVLTDQLAKDYDFKQNGTHFSLVIPFHSFDVATEAVHSSSVKSRLDVQIRKPGQGWTIAQFSLGCVFPAFILACKPDGKIAALAVKLEAVPSLNTAQLTLNDPSCGPIFSDARVAFFYFNANSCGTNRTFQDGMMVYENQATVKDVQNKVGLSDVEPKYRFRFSCAYMVNSSRTLSFSTMTQTKAPMAYSSVGQLEVQIRLARDLSYTQFYNDVEYPVVKHLSRPLYFEVELMQFDKTDVELIVTDCWATLSGARKSQPRWHLLVDGCPNPEDPDQVVFHPVRPDHRVLFPSLFKRFEAKMFSFAEHEDAPVGQVVFQCNVVICDRGVHQDGLCHGPCAGLQMGTSNVKRGRRAAPEKQLDSLSSGPRAAPKPQTAHVVSGLIILL